MHKSGSRSTGFTAALAAATFLALPAHAQHAGDVTLGIDGGRIHTSVEVGEGLIEPSRVFASELGEVEPGFTDEPGFDCEAGTFPVPSAIGFRIVGPLLRWHNGIGDGRTPASMQIAFSSLGPIESPDCNVAAEGFSLSVAANGTWHRHLEFSIDPAADEGVYILGLELFTSAASIGDSKPFWIVFNHGSDDEAHAGAIEWTRATLAGSACAADFDASGDVGVPDIFAFLSAWFAGTDSPGAWRTDFNGSCTIDVPDIFAFLSAWFGPCE
jgi:hypothetical protein